MISERVISKKEDPYMQNGASLSRSILVAGLITGILADALLRATPWGLNLLLWVLAPVGSTVLLARRDKSARERYLIRIGAGAAAFAAGFAWRDSSVLVGLDIIALFGLFSLGSLRTALRSVRSASLWEYTVSSFTSGFASAFGMFGLLINDIKWKPNGSVFRSRPIMAIGRGVLLALPLILVFGWLFAGADPVFGSLVGKAFNINMDFPDLLVHLLIISACCWCAGGYMRRVLANAEVPAEEGAGRIQPFLLGVVDISVALGLVNILFLAFVIVQFRYFFGGGERVQTVAGLTYSEYARQGFFELVAVAALALPVLLVADWLAKKQSRQDEILFRSMAAILIGLLFVIMISAVQRMSLYLREYGQTELRTYTTAFMAWLAILFLWFGATVLRGRRDRFAFGAVLSGFVIIGILHLANPDAMIVRTNAGRAACGRSFDVAYNTSLSADSVPELVRDLGLLRSEDQARVARSLLDNWGAPKGDWRTWNRDRAAAVHAVQRARPVLEGYAASTYKQPISAAYVFKAGTP
jgi:hypothetical protein